MAESLAGQLLLASPTLRDPNFQRTVVLVGVHDEDGAMGLVLNRPSRLTIAETVPQLQEAAGGAEPVYVGGPVAQGAVLMLAEFADPEAAGLLIVGRIGFPALDAASEELAAAVVRARVYAGYAGWASGQLDSEVSGGDWIPQAALAQDVFTDEPEQLWARALARKGGSYALLARMPPDPSVN